MGEKEPISTGLLLTGYGEPIQITEFKELPDITEENCEAMAAELFKGNEIGISFTCKLPFRLRLLLWYYEIRMQLKHSIFVLQLFFTRLKWKITGEI